MQTGEAGCCAPPTRALDASPLENAVSFRFSPREQSRNLILPRSTRFDRIGDSFEKDPPSSMRKTQPIQSGLSLLIALFLTVGWLAAVGELLMVLS